MFAIGTATQSQAEGVGFGKLGGVLVDGQSMMGGSRLTRGRWINIESQG